MSMGHGVWETSIAIGLQDTVDEVASDLYLLKIDGSDSLTFGAQMMDRSPTYGNRLRPEQAYRKDTELPAGALGPWALRMDEDNRGLLMTLDMFYQRYNIISGGTLAADDWTFQAIGTYNAIASMHLYSVRKAIADGDGDYEIYVDAIANGLSHSWSTGNGWAITPDIQSLTATVGTNATTGTDFGGIVLDTPEISPTMEINGTSYILYPSAISINESNNMPDASAAGVAQRPRLVIGNYSGDLSMTLPRNTFTGKVKDAYDADYTGTFKVAFRPSSGTYSTGGGTLAADYTAYVKLDIPPNPAGGDGEAMFELTGQLVQAATWLVKSDLSSL